MSYNVKLKIFEGPLDLLLFLIKKEKVDIYDIPISKVTEQYLEYLELMKLLDLEIAGEFLVWAATLMHIKSRVLLADEENELVLEEEGDPRDELVKRLLEYKKYKEAAQELAQMQEAYKGVFLRKASHENEWPENDSQGYFEASLFDLITAFQKILKEIPKEVFYNVVKAKFSVSDKIHEIYHLLAEQSRILFSSIFQKAQNKDEMIALFLAILELIKMREILVVQKEFFGEIEIIRNPELAKASS